MCRYVRDFQSQVRFLGMFFETNGFESLSRGGLLESKFWDNTCKDRREAGPDRGCN